MNWFELIVTIGYIGGVFILLPLVIYTTLKERLYNPGNSKLKETIENISEAERNKRAMEILEKVETKMDSFVDENGENCFTINKGAQARFMKNALDYINKKLAPTDSTILEMIGEITELYKNRTKRIFTGSYWIVACAAGLAILLTVTAGGFTTFTLLQIAGVIFYILSSRTPYYAFEKRMDKYGGNSSLISTFMTLLFIGNQSKHYVKRGDGPWERDYESEAGESIIHLIIMFVVAVLLGFLVAFLGIISFLSNFVTSLVLPFKKEEQWYIKNFSPVTE